MFSLQEEGGCSLAGRTLVCARIPLQQAMLRQATLNGGADSIAQKGGGERRWVSSFLHFNFYRVSTSYDGSGRQEDGRTLSPQSALSISALVERLHHPRWLALALSAAQPHGGPLFAFRGILVGFEGALD